MPYRLSIRQYKCTVGHNIPPAKQFCDFAVNDRDLLRKPSQNIDIRKEDFANAKSWL